MSYWF